MHDHVTALLTTTFLMLSSTRRGMLSKLFKQSPLVGYVLVGRNGRWLVCHVDLDNGFQLSSCAIKNPSCWRTTNAEKFAYLNVNGVKKPLNMAAHLI